MIKIYSDWHRFTPPERGKTDLFGDIDIFQPRGIDLRICECGAETCNTTHALWCPKYEEIKFEADV